MPRTLVHGDFVGKNVRVRKGPTGSTLLPFDWESAGYGVPAADLDRLDTAVYYSTISEFWTSLRLEDVQQLAKYGRISWLINFVFWAAPNLAYPWVEKTMRRQMIYYHSWLTDSIRMVGWEK
jgi:aminoglycoside phosphotransferase (APT) family kinase protein